MRSWLLRDGVPTRSAPARDASRGVYDIERGTWVACERCSGTGRVMVYLYPKLRHRPR